MINPPDYSNEVFASSMSSTLMYYLFRRAPEIDSLYNYDESKNTLIPVFTVHFNNDIKRHSYSKLPGYYSVELMTDNSYSTILIDEKTLRGSYVNKRLDMLGWIGCRGWFHQGYFTVNSHPSVLKEQLEAALSYPENMTEEIKEKITELNNSITDDDNNIVLIGTLKK